ncbi:hypothetical protein THAOC_08890, partial [Thalassiosira oceanica]
MAITSIIRFACFRLLRIIRFSIAWYHKHYCAKAYVGATVEEEKGAGSTGGLPKRFKRARRQGGRQGPGNPNSRESSDNNLGPALAHAVPRTLPTGFDESVPTDRSQFCQVSYLTPGVASFPLSAAWSPVPELTKDIERRLYYNREDLQLSDGFALQIMHQEE